MVSSNGVEAQTATRYTSLASWEAVVFGSDLFQTTASNVLLADEVTSLPGDDTSLGSPLTFQPGLLLEDGSTLTRGFQIMTGQEGAGFVFNGRRPDSSSTDWVNALSIGDGDVYEDDDWTLSMLNGATMSAFGVELRNNQFETGETIKLINTNTAQEVTISLSDLPAGSSNAFLGFTTDFLFNQVVFDEHDVGDNIGLADIRFAVAPEPVSSILFIIGGTVLGLNAFRKKRTA